MSTLIAVDTCVLINFLRINRMDLIGRYPGKFFTTDDVANEIIYDDRYANERILYKEALRDGRLVQVDMTFREMEIRRMLRSVPLGSRSQKKKPLGRGERSAIAVAIIRKYSLATDDEDAIRCIPDLAAIFGNQLSNLRTQDIMVELIKRQVLSVKQADVILAVWKGKHKFDLKIESFRKLL